MTDANSLSPAAAEDLALFHRTLAELCRSNLPLPQALRTLQDELQTAGLRAAVTRLTEAVESGTPLPDAYAEQAQAFPVLYRTLVEAGIATGDLPGVLAQIADHADLRADVTARIREPLAYPMMAGGFVIVIGGAVSLTLFPRFSALMEQVFGGMDIELPMFTRFVMAGGPLIGLAVLGVLVVFGMWLRGPLEGTGVASAWSFRLPVYGRLRHYGWLSMVAATLGLLLRRGMPLGQALGLAAATANDESLRTHLVAMQASAEGGAGLADTLREGGLFAPSLLWIVGAAEQRGAAPDALDDVAAIYRKRLERTVDRTALVVMPIATLIVGIAVFMIALGFFLPIFELQRQLSI